LLKRNIAMKRLERLVVYASLLICIVLLHRSCEANNPTKTKTITIDIPKIIGDFKPVKPVQKTINIDSILNLVKDTLTPEINIIKKAVKANDSLEKKYLALQDEFKRFKLFQEFISIRKFKHTFEDENLIANISGINRGMIESITIDHYEIKERQQGANYELPRIKRFSIGPYVGYDVFHGNYSGGVSIQYGIIRF